MDTQRWSAKPISSRGTHVAQNPSHLKRQKELARREWQQEKRVKREQRKIEKERRERLEAPKPGEATPPADTSSQAE